MKPEEGNESLDTIMSRAIGEQPLLSFSRAGDGSAKLVQILQALEQQEHNQGWPLLSSLKVQVQKCDKCFREYCSTINYRRHQHLHHRFKTLVKEASGKREWLGTFWDKLSLDAAKEVVSFKDVALEEVPGSSIITALSTLVRKPGFSSLPQLYLKAGSDILDIVQGRPSRFPISASDLFSILDYASEKTFLYGSISIQNHFFDGDAARTGLETKNIVACSSFLLEQKLINAWLAEKDAEALRFQKLLVQEEEAARKRRAEDLEKKRKKRLKQKAQKENEQRDDEEKADVNETIEITSAEKVDVNETINNALKDKVDVNKTTDNASEEKVDVDMTVDNASEEKADVNETMDNAAEETPSAEISSSVTCDPQIDATKMPYVVQHLSTVKHSNTDMNPDFDSITGFDGGQTDIENSSPVDEGQFVQACGRRQRHRRSQKSQLGASPGFHTTQGSPAPSVAPSCTSVALGSQVSKPSIGPTSSDAARVSQVPKPAIVPTSSDSGRNSQEPKPAVAPTRSEAARVSQAPKPALAPTSSCAPRVPQAPRPAFAPTGSGAPRVYQAPKPALAPTSCGVARGSPTSKPAVAPTSIYVARGSPASKLANIPTKFGTAWVSQAPKPAVAPSTTFEARDFPALKRADTPTKSGAAQVSQTPKPAITPSSTCVAQRFPASKPVVASTSSGAAQVSQAPKPAVASTSSGPARVSQAPKPPVAPSTISLAQGSSDSKPAITPTSSDTDQVSQASKTVVQRIHGHRNPRILSTGQKVWSLKQKPEFDGHSSEARIQEVPPNELEKTKKHEFISSPTKADNSEARVQKDTAHKPTQTKEHKFMIGSLPFPLDDLIRTVNKQSEAPSAPMPEPKKPDPSTSGTSGQQKGKLWREMLVPNGSMESEGGTLCSTSTGIEMVPHKNLLEHGDWESTIHILQIFQNQRWKSAIAREHVTLVVLDSDEEIAEIVES